MHVKIFVFNPFQVNTYLLYTAEGHGVVIDPGMSNPLEEQAFQQYLDQHGIRLIGAINTHGHVDHIVGNNFVRTQYGVPLYVHKASVIFLRQAHDHGAMYGFRIPLQPAPAQFLEEGDTFSLGEEELKVIYPPGHADGSICLYDAKGARLYCGDVLFNGSIGRTDLPTGNMGLLLQGIREKLFTLPSHTEVFPGHGPRTSIGMELQTNPFLQ
jgi:glyoxylase-like metal-dependent hydrolase (beta-lactamase superfamily II)